MHIPTSVENDPIPSREAETTATPLNPEPPYVGLLFGSEPEHHPLPPIVSDLVSEVSELAEAQPTAVAAVALSTLVAVVGPKVKLQRTRSRHALGFSVIIGHEAPRTLPWFDAITAPFVGHALDLQLVFCRQGTKKINELIEQQREELEQVNRTLAPNAELVTRLRTELDRAPTQLKPNVASSSVVPKNLARMLTDSFDGGMVLTGLGNDPGADLLRLKAPERAQLAEAISRSWDGMPLTLGQAFCEAHLSLLWQTREPLKALFGKRGFQPDFVPVPTLLFSDTSVVGRRIGTFPSEDGWKKLCGEIFHVRRLNRQAVFTFHAEAEAALADFAKHVATNIASVPAKLRGAVDWLPDLAARLAALFLILSARVETVVEKIAVVEAIKTTKWLGRQHLLAAVAATAATDTADSADKKPVLLAKIRAKGPISRRELRRTFDDQRARWFDEALDTLIEEKKVRYDESVRLVPCL